MNKKILIGIITVLVLYNLVLLIVAEILAESRIQLVQHIVFWIPLAIWTFLIWRVWIKEQRLAEKQLKRLKTFMLMGIVSWGLLYLFFPHIWLAITGLHEWEGSLFFIPIILILLCIAGIISSLVVFLRGRQKTAVG